MILKTKIDPTSWPFLGLKPPFYGDFSGIFDVQIDPKMAEKARIWPPDANFYGL